jgi:Na+/phosphate symporter
MGIREKIERIMMAITFAEAGEHDTARKFMRDEKRVRKSKRASRRPRPQLRAPSSRQ